MRKILFLLITAFWTLCAKAELPAYLSFSTTIGTGISMSTPAHTPFSWQFTGYYNFSKRLSAGIGTGVSVYEKLLIPVFADVKFDLAKPSKFALYAECGAGYSFAASRNSVGGFFLNPSIGMEYTISCRKKVSFAIGYEIQKLRRLKKYENGLFTATFEEHLDHNSISIKTGFCF